MLDQLRSGNKRIKAIWLALIIFTFEMIRLWRAERLPAEAAPPIAD